MSQIYAVEGIRYLRLHDHTWGVSWDHNLCLSECHLKYQSNDRILWLRLYPWQLIALGIVLRLLGAEYGAVTALSINEDCTRLLVGHARGQVSMI